jgi:hypothetical protein
MSYFTDMSGVPTMANIKSVLDASCASLKIDSRLLKDIHRYGQLFCNKNTDHVQFFGGNLTGVNPIRFMASDKNEWVDELLGIDEYATRQAIIALPTIDAEWVRGTDVMNISCLYLAHRVMNSALPHNTKIQGMTDIFLVMQYKLLSSLMAHFFRYPADEATALATYAALSKKYAIKQHGNWHAVLAARSADIIDKNSIHYQTLLKFNDDAAIVYMITDIQGRLRAMIKKIWVVFDLVRTQDAKILTTGGTVVLDGKTVVRDVARNYTPYRRYLSEVVLDKPRFIKSELVGVIASAMHTMPAALLIDTLNSMSDRARTQDKAITALLDDTLLHAFDYLSTDRRAQELMTNIPSLIAKLRALYMASRSSDPALMRMRTQGEAIVKKAIKSRNPSVVASVRTGVMLYLVLRTFAMQHYN